MTARRTSLLPLVPLYSAALAVKARLRPAPAHRLTHPVISIGSLSAGGAGKTPVVAALANLLTHHGYSVDILSRGYGRSSKAIARVDPRGTASLFGDEPLLLAQQTGVPVYVGADRHAAGLLAEHSLAPTARHVHLLDDGFQHQQLARALDLVLLTAEDAADHLLPAGNLREPLLRLSAADVVLLRADEADALSPTLGRFAPEKARWLLQRTLHLPPAAPSQSLAFCAIARPADFFAMLACSGRFPAATRTFRDHHQYRYRDISSLIDTARKTGASSFLTTEKDLVKLSPAMRARLQTFAPLIAAPLSVTFLDEPAVLRALAAHLA